MIPIYLGVATGVMFAAVGAFIAGLCATVYVIRRDYKRKKLELANTSAGRKTDHELVEFPLETIDDKQ